MSGTTALALAGTIVGVAIVAWVSALIEQADPRVGKAVFVAGLTLVTLPATLFVWALVYNVVLGVMCNGRAC